MAKFNRRQMLKLSGAVALGTLLEACGAQPTPQVVEKVVKETVEVQKEVEKVVTQQVEVEKVVTATPGPKEVVTIVATSQMSTETFTNAVTRAKDLLPNINLKVTNTQIVNWAGYSDLVITQIAGGEQLDVIMIAVEGVPLLGRKKILIPLESYIAADAGAQATIADTHPLLLSMLQYQGKQLEIPFSWNNMVMYYNTKIFKDKGIDPPKPDWTWDDFIATSTKVASVKGTADDLYAYSFWGGTMFGMCAWYFVNDTSPLTDDWKNSNMLDPKVAETLQFLADLILKYKVTPNPSGWDENGQ